MLMSYEVFRVRMLFLGSEQNPFSLKREAFLSSGTGT